MINENNNTKKGNINIISTMLGSAATLNKFELNLFTVFNVFGFVGLE